MKKNTSFRLLVAALGVATMMVSCKKQETTIPPAQVHFTGAAQQAYAVRAAGVAPYTIQIGTTDVANTDRTVGVKVTSRTAVAGTQYTVSANTVTIPAGQALGSFNIQGIFAGYPVGRVDTLVITLTEPSITPAKFMDTIRLAIGDICVEGVGFNLSSVIGTYARTVEVFGTNAPYGPYTTTISSATSTGTTTARIVVQNLWDNGWGPISFDLNWGVTPLTATVVTQTAIPGSNAGDINPTYAGQTIAIRPMAGSPGTFSTCYNTFTLRSQLGVTNLGYFASLYTVNMAR
ncbi:hypothetical protein JMG10_08950 [Nostoc ellipsosporum NOK]|nr:hypothetical protein [Nostoc ellipsosporum NOK]